MVGLVLIIIGLLSAMTKGIGDDAVGKRDTKAIVFLGPIPLVWGYSRRMQLILAIFAVAIFFVCILYFS